MKAKQAGLTKNQSVVLAALETAGTPMTAYEILDLPAVRREGLKAPLTIYRALEKLVTCGLVHRIESLNAFVACADSPHAEPCGFLICDRCRKTVELRIEDCEAQLVGRARKVGFDVRALRVELTGRCEDCQTAAA